MTTTWLEMSRLNIAPSDTTLSELLSSYGYSAPVNEYKLSNSGTPIESIYRTSRIWKKSNNKGNGKYMWYHKILGTDLNELYLLVILTQKRNCLISEVYLRTTSG